MGNINKATHLVFAVSPDVWYQGDMVESNRQHTLYLHSVLTQNVMVTWAI